MKKEKVVGHVDILEIRRNPDGTKRFVERSEQVIERAATAGSRKALPKRRRAS
jgi:hypothetical protein